MTSKPRRWLRWGAFAGALAFLLLVAAAGCSRQPIVLGPAHRFPAPETLVLQTPPGAGAGDTVTQASMRNIMLHLDDDTYLHVHRLQGRMHDLRHTGVILLDDKNTLLLEISDAVLGMSADDLTRLLNRYVFGYPGAPLTDLRAELRGSQMLLSGTLHKGAALPFEMTSEVSLTPQGGIRVHATSVRLCGADGLALLHALGLHLSDMIDLRGAKGVRADGNDLLLDPFQILPPPRISGRLTAVRIEGGEMVQVFGREDAAPPAPPVASESYVYFRGGTLQFGKLFMVAADMEAIDSDVSDPFDFYLDFYASQLVAGYHVTTARGGMVAYFPDFADLGTRATTRTPPAVPAQPVAQAAAAAPAS
ncbi:MAG TPA: hypothetical protein VFT45_12880 [Longimicrobium sp.]|nr:hypothetical protein [Longimicrobium sp.]